MLSNNHSQDKTQNRWAILVWVIVLSLLLAACSGTQAKKPFTIGVVAEAVIMSPAIEGFKAGMTDLGYAEGKDVTYVYNGPTGSNAEAVDREIKNLLAQKVDMLVVIGVVPTKQSKQAVAGTNIPVVFTGTPADVVQSGLVESTSHPGDNLTGVQITSIDAKALELFASISPQAKKIYVPYNPADEIAVGWVAGLEQAAAQEKIELVQGKVKSAEEAVAAIESLPADIDAIFRIPSPTLEAKNAELSQAAIKRGLPTIASSPIDEAIMLTVAMDPVEIGKQGARLVHQIRQGVKPADLPIETAEFYSTINLKTAQAIGLDIPDEILLQADIIIR
jgi:putative ABC transport system substrate-binding protein